MSSARFEGWGPIKTLSSLVMVSILWSESPEGSKYWNGLFIHSPCNGSDRDKQLTLALLEIYPDPAQRTKNSQNNYRRALKLIATYEKRFGNLPSVELLNSVLE